MSPILICVKKYGTQRSLLQNAVIFTLSNNPKCTKLKFFQKLTEMLYSLCSKRQLFIY
jgi:hypothetical protein